MSRPAWTISEVVERTGASRSTIRRYRDAGKFPHAFKDPAGVWRVPIEDLLAAGLSVSDPARAEQVSRVSEQAQSAADQADVVLREKVAELERALAVEQARNEGLERAAAAAEQNAKDLRQALRMLEVGRSERPMPEQVDVVSEPVLSRPADHPVNTPEQAAEPAPRKGWIQRLRAPRK